MVWVSLQLLRGASVRRNRGSDSDKAGWRGVAGRQARKSQVEDEDMIAPARRSGGQKAITRLETGHRLHRKLLEKGYDGTAGPALQAPVR